MSEHIHLAVGDVIKLMPAAFVYSVPRGVELTIIRVLLADTPEEREYELGWPGKPTRYTVFMEQGAADRYAKKLMREGQADA